MQLPISRAAAGALAALVARAHMAHQLTGHMLEQVCTQQCMAGADGCDLGEQVQGCRGQAAEGLRTQMLRACLCVDERVEMIEREYSLLMVN